MQFILKEQLPKPSIIRKLSELIPKNFLNKRLQSNLSLNLQKTLNLMQDHRRGLKIPITNKAQKQTKQQKINKLFRKRYYDIKQNTNKICKNSLGFQTLKKQYKIKQKLQKLQNDDDSDNQLNMVKQSCMLYGKNRLADLSCIFANLQSKDTIKSTILQSESPINQICNSKSDKVQNVIEQKQTHTLQKVNKDTQQQSKKQQVDTIHKNNGKNNLYQLINQHKNTNNPFLNKSSNKPLNFVDIFGQSYKPPTLQQHQHTPQQPQINIQPHNNQKQPFLNTQAHFNNPNQNLQQYPTNNLNNPPSNHFQPIPNNYSFIQNSNSQFGNKQRQACVALFSAPTNPNNSSSLFSQGSESTTRKVSTKTNKRNRSKGAARIH